MTHGTIAILLGSLLQTDGFFLSDPLDPVEVNLHLDKGLQDFIEETLSGLRSPQTQGGSFEANSIRLDDLQKLKKTSDPLPKEADSDPPKFPLPEDYNNYIKVVGTIEAECLENPIKSKVRILQSETIEELLQDSYHKSTMNSPVGEIEDDFVKVNLNGFTVKEVVIQYLKNPVKFDVVGKKDDEYPLPDRTINRILDKVAIELTKVLENQAKAQSLQQNKLF